MLVHAPCKLGERINDEAGYYVPESLMDWANRYQAHRPERGI